MPGFMKDVGHAMAALLIQVETGQLIFAVRSVLLSERVVMATRCDLLYRHLPVCDLPRRRCGPDKEPLPAATPVFAVAVALDFEAAD
jgi:hypothetical protein